MTMVVSVSPVVSDVSIRWPYVSCWDKDSEVVTAILCCVMKLVDGSYSINAQHAPINTLGPD